MSSLPCLDDARLADLPALDCCEGTWFASANDIVAFKSVGIGLAEEPCAWLAAQRR